MLTHPRNNEPGQPSSRPVGEQGMSPGGNTRPPGNNTRPPVTNTRPPGNNTRPPGNPTRPPGSNNTRPPNGNTRPPNGNVRPSGNDTLPPAARSHPRTVSSASMEIIRAINPRRLVVVWLVAILAAGALVFLFPRTLQETPRRATTTLAPSATPTGAVESAAQVWGAQATAFYTLAGSAGSFIPTDIDPAAGFVAGYVPTNGGGYSIATIALPTAMNPATPTAAPTPQTLCASAQDSVTPPTVITDGTYLAWLATSANGTQTINYASLHSQNCTQAGMNTLPMKATDIFALDYGHLVWQQAGNLQALQMQDLTMPTSTPVTISLSAPLPTKTTLGIQLVWPHLLYQAANGVIHVVDLSNSATPLDAAYPVIKLSRAAPQIQLTTQGITWLAPISGHPILRAWHLTWTTPLKASAIVNLPTAHAITHLAAASAVIAWDNGAAFQAWDAERRVFVALHAAPTTGATLAAHGTLLWYLTDDASSPSLAVIDTSTLGK